MADDKPSRPDLIDPRLVRRLAEILRAADLTEIEVEGGELKIRVKREIARAALEAAPPSPARVAATPAAPPAVEDEAEAPVGATPSRGKAVKSPMVGTVYLAAEPGTAPFVQPGDRVEPGQTLLIIEAMKTMNAIPAPRAGVVVELLVDNEQPVEFGEPLVTIE